MTDVDDTLIGGLARRRNEIAAAQVLRLKVPRWEDPTISVLYRPLNSSEVFKTFDKANDAKGDPALIRLNAEASLLIDACVGVEAVREDGRSQKWAGFDPELAAELGVEDPGTINTLKQLFLTDGDILAHSRELAAWSGSANEKLQKDFAEK